MLRRKTPQTIDADATQTPFCYEVWFPTKKDFRINFRKSFCGSGEGGIRTLGTLAGTLVFETSTIGHSVTSPSKDEPANVAAREWGADDSGHFEETPSVLFLID